MSSPLKLFNRPELVEAREAPDALLRAGRRPDSGYGVERQDRWWITYARGGSRKRPAKLHVDFAPFNTTKRDQQKKIPGVEKPIWLSPSTTIRGVLAYVDLAAACKIDRLCYRGPKDRRVKNPTSNRPWCHGDGVTAQRWDGRQYQDIECPGGDCPFSQDSWGGGRPCKPGITVLFCPLWAGTRWADSGMPSPLIRYHSRNPATASSFRGMIKSCRDLAKGILRQPEFEITNWLGLPFRLTIGQSESSKGRYTNVAFSRDGDFAAWLEDTVSAPPLAIAAGSQPGLLNPGASDDPWPAIDADLVSPEPIACVKPVAVTVAPLLTEDERRRAEKLFLDHMSEIEMAAEHGPSDTWTASTLAEAEGLK